MQLIGSIVPNQYWQDFIIPIDTDLVIIDYTPLIPELEDIRSMLIVRRSFIINGLLVKDEPFETLPKTDNEIIIFRALSQRVKNSITESFVEVIKVYKPTHYTYVEPNYMIHLYHL